MNVKAAPGRVVIKILDKIRKTEDGEGDFYIPQAQTNNFGEVVDVGPPDELSHGLGSYILWKVLGIHPCPYKVGDKVLLPHLKGRVFSMDGSEYFVYFHQDIGVYES